MGRGLLLAMLVALGSACWWEPQQGIERALWSDDDSEQAYVLSRWEAESGVLGVTEGARAQGFRGELWLQRADGGNPHLLYAPPEGAGIVGVYHMVASGYTVVALQLADRLRLFRIDAAGQRRTIAESDVNLGLCGFFDAIPAPDGQTLALIERRQPPPSPDPVPAGAVASCTHGEVRVSLRDAATLQTTAGPWSWSVDEAIEPTWTPQGALVVQSGAQAWRIDAVDGPVSSALPGCTYPRTTSSEISADGVMIGPGDLDQPVQEIARGAKAFGCQ